MIDLAKAALNNAISLEVKKDGLQQRQSGDWTLRLVFGAIDYNEQLGRAPMGTRYACVLVEVNDDESPVDHATIEKGKWRDLGPARQAGMRCKEPMFWAFLREHPDFSVNAIDEATAADAVREICGLTSRADLGKIGETRAREIWFGLDNEFQAWRAAENG